MLIGLILLAAGVGVTLLSYGVFGTARAGRSLLDPIMVDTVATEPVLWRAIAIAGGIAPCGDAFRRVHPPGSVPYMLKAIQIRREAMWIAPAQQSGGLTPG